MATLVHMVAKMGWVTYKGSEAKSKVKISYAHFEIRIQVVMICGPTHYQLDHEGNQDNDYVFVLLLIHTLRQYKYIIINSS